MLCPPDITRSLLMPVAPMLTAQMDMSPSSVRGRSHTCAHSFSLLLLFPPLPSHPCHFPLPLSLCSQNLIDLAGSENHKATVNASDTRRREGSFINKSLLALGTVRGGRREGGGRRRRMAGRRAGNYECRKQLIAGYKQAVCSGY